MTIHERSRKRQPRSERTLTLGILSIELRKPIVDQKSFVDYVPLLPAVIENPLIDGTGQAASNVAEKGRGATKAAIRVYEIHVSAVVMGARLGTYSLHYADNASNLGTELDKCNLPRS
jgi:hypothetical protein